MVHAEVEVVTGLTGLALAPLQEAAAGLRCGTGCTFALPAGARSLPASLCGTHCIDTSEADQASGSRSRHTVSLPCRDRYGFGSVHDPPICHHIRRIAGICPCSSQARPAEAVQEETADAVSQEGVRM